MLTILVVDDNREFCQNLADILEMEGHQVITAYDGMEAVGMVEGEHPDLIILDVKLPGMDGVATFRRVRRMAPQTPVILMSAYAVEDMMGEALREGAFGVLRKPLDIDRLLSTIKDSIGGKRRVLVVDDDEELCASLKDALEQKGCRVTTAHSGSEAVQRSWESSFDLVLLDMKLPHLNGLQTYVIIREIRPRMQVIMITGYPTEMGGLLRQAMAEGATTCLEKPVDMAMLVSLLEQVKGQGAEGTQEGQ